MTMSNETKMIDSFARRLSPLHLKIMHISSADQFTWRGIRKVNKLLFLNEHSHEISTWKLRN